ncbi:hypothetical protein KZ870_38755, partial [Pseudomonas aeruginosa]|nr:hypothetical protein [Pseudomonas aeruginosa]
IDAAVSLERQNYMFDILYDILQSDFKFENKLEARSFMNELRQNILDMNLSRFKEEKFSKLEITLKNLVRSKKLDFRGA